MPVQYEWAEYRELRRLGRLRLGITDAAAQQIARLPELHPSSRSVIRALMLWRSIAWACLIAGLALAVIWHWWAMLVGFGALYIIWQAANMSLKQGLLQAADEDERFYTRAAAAGAWHYDTPTPN